MKKYSLREIFRIVLDIEEKGKNFYENLSDYIKKKDLQNLFLYLAKEELKHTKRFSKIYHTYSKKDIYFLADESFEEFFDMLLRAAVFPDISEVRDELNSKDNITSVIKIAMEIETNTILFYQELKEHLKQKELEQVLEKIIKEEKNHLIKLKNVRLDLDPFYTGIRYGKFF